MFEISKPFSRKRILANSLDSKEGLSRKYQQRIWIGFGIVGITFGASIITIYSACQPISKYWQINPDPGSKIASFTRFCN
jgi:hypothetical protein